MHSYSDQANCHKKIRKVWQEHIESPLEHQEGATKKEQRNIGLAQAPIQIIYYKNKPVKTSQSCVCRQGCDEDIFCDHQHQNGRAGVLRNIL
jgi:hypothetical protein